MWYTVYDTMARTGRQFAYSIEQWQHLWDRPQYKTYAPWVMNLTNASLQTMQRLYKEYSKPTFGISHVSYNDGKTYPVSEATIWDKPFCKLIRFEKEGITLSKKPLDVLIVAPLSGHYATLLRDTVKGILAYADRVYITDWKNARDVPMHEGTFHFVDYVHYVEDALRTLPNRVHIMAVCQPTVPVLAACSRMAQYKDPHRPLTMTLIGGPVDARQSPTSVNNYATSKPLSWFEQNVIDSVPIGYAGVGRRVYPGFLQHFGFVAMNPQRHAKAYQHFFQDLLKGDKDDTLKHKAFYDEYNAVLDLDAAFYLETIDLVFQRFALAEGTMELDGELIKPDYIKDIPMFTIEGEKDDVAGVGQTEAAHKLCTGLTASKKQHWIVPNVGHYGVFSGSTYKTDITPKIEAWQRKYTA